MDRILKQIVITIVFILILISLTAFLFSVTKKEASCFDNKQNQDEEGVDCGGICESCELAKLEDFKLLQLQTLETGDGNYDLLAKIKNPNANYGAQKFSYSFVFIGNDGVKIESFTGDNFILPLETKYIFVPNLKLKNPKADLKFKIQNINWAGLENEIPKILLFNKKFNFSKSELEFFSFSATLINKSPASYPKVEVVLAIFDNNNKLLTINGAELNKVSFDQERNLKMVWSLPFKGVPKRFEVGIYTNPF